MPPCYASGNAMNPAKTMLDDLFQKNRYWAKRLSGENPELFPALAQQQNPDYLWIGCSDARVPANEIVGLLPGELFVHRNVANLVMHNDMNVLSVLQYAVEVLKVRHVIVTGHYSCGGVRTAIDAADHGLIDNWLRPIRSLHVRHAELFEGLDEQQAVDLLCELNVIEQVRSVADTTIVHNAWQRGQVLTVHGCIFSVHDGILHDLGVSTSSPGELIRPGELPSRYTPGVRPHRWAQAPSPGQS